MAQLNTVLASSSSADVTRVFDPNCEEDRLRWDAYVDAAPVASPAHRMGWMRVVKKVFGHKAYPLAIEGANGSVRGILPLVFMKSSLFGSFLVSMPFLNYGGVLADSPDMEGMLLDEAGLLRERLGAEHVELRHAGTFVDGLPMRSHKVSMHLPLCETEQEQWAGLNAKVRNQVRKAEKSGLTVVVGDRSLLDDFYSVFAHNMRDLGTPVYPKAFFSQLLDEFKDSSRIVMVWRGGKRVAGALVMWHHGRLEIPWASSLREYNSMCPNNLLYWEAIRFGIDLKMSVFDFGRSSPGGGTYKFKAQWGATPVQLHWQYILKPKGAMPDITPTNPRYQAAIAVWKRLPVTVTKVLGPLLVRSIP